MVSLPATQPRAFYDSKYRFCVAGNENGSFIRRILLVVVFPSRWTKQRYNGRLLWNTFDNPEHFNHCASYHDAKWWVWNFQQNHFLGLFAFRSFNNFTGISAFIVHVCIVYLSCFATFLTLLILQNNVDSDPPQLIKFLRCVKTLINLFICLNFLSDVSMTTFMVKNRRLFYWNSSEQENIKYLIASLSHNHKNTSLRG